MSEEKNKEAREFFEKAQLVFMVNFDEDQQNIVISENVSIANLVTTPFRYSVHLNQLIEEAIKQNERQAGEAVAEDKEAEAE